MDCYERRRPSWLFSFEIFGLKLLPNHPGDLIEDMGSNKLAQPCNSDFFWLEATKLFLFFDSYLLGADHE
jgi:hypothetical protein